MHEPESNRNRTKKTSDDSEYAVGPTLYSTIIQTESKLRHVSRSRSEQKPVANNVSLCVYRLTYDIWHVINRFSNIYFIELIM